MNKNGFSRAKLITVILLLLAVVAAAAWPYYLKKAERRQVQEIDRLLIALNNAQVQHKQTTGNYTEVWTQLDAAPQGAAAVNVYCTKGPQPTVNDGACAGNGFQIKLIGTNAAPGNTSGVEAIRSGSSFYSYKLWKKYGEAGSEHCDINGNEKKNKKFCIAYSGNEKYTEYASPLKR